jgi:hypothetical protein
MGVWRELRSSEIGRTAGPVPTLATATRALRAAATSTRVRALTPDERVSRPFGYFPSTAFPSNFRSRISELM